MIYNPKTISELTKYCRINVSGRHIYFTKEARRIISNSPVSFEKNGVGWNLLLDPDGFKPNKSGVICNKMMADILLDSFTAKKIRLIMKGTDNPKVFKLFINDKPQQNDKCN